MESPAFSKQLKASQTILNCVRGAMLAATSVLTLVIFATPRPPLASQEMPYVLLGAAAMIAVASLLIRKALISDAKLKAVASRAVALEDFAKDPNTGEIDQNRLATYKEFSSRELRLMRIAGAVIPAGMFAASSSEAVAIMGVVSGLSGAPAELFLPAIIAGVALQFISFPNVYETVERAKRLPELAVQ